MTLREWLLYAKKAVGAVGTVEATAVALGLLDNAEAGYVTAGVGAATGAIVYLLRNIPPAAKGTPAEQIQAGNRYIRKRYGIPPHARPITVGPSTPPPSDAPVEPPA